MTWDRARRRFAHFVYTVRASFGTMERVKAWVWTVEIFVEVLCGWGVIGGFIVVESPLLLGPIDKPEIIDARISPGGFPRLNEIGDGQRHHQDRQTEADIADDKSSQSQAVASERAGRTIDASESDVAADNCRNGKQNPDTKKRHETDNSEHEAPDREGGIPELRDGAWS